MATVSRGRTSQRYQFIERNREQFKVTFLCKWLKVSTSGYYDWRKRLPSNRDEEDQKLVIRIHSIHQKSRGTYGSPRVYKALRQQDIRIGKKRVERLMRSQDIRGRVVEVTHRHPGLKGFTSRGENLRLNQPEASRINQVWVADVTYIKVNNRWLYLAVVMDIYSRRILGWSLSKTRTVDLTLTALNYALKRRNGIGPGIFHTDRGIEYAAHRFQAVLRKLGIKHSVNRLGHCTDNAHMESFFHSLKAELIRGRWYTSEGNLRLALNSYINQFYNYQRLHSGIGYHPPVVYERMAA